VEGGGDDSRVIVMRKIPFLLGIVTMLSQCREERLNIDFRANDIESINLVISHRDIGNMTRQFREIELPSTKFQEFIQDLQQSKKKGKTKVLRQFTIIVLTKNGDEIELVGRDRLITDRADDVYFESKEKLIEKYWSIDLSKGGF
jgi:hypothetical protein